MASSGTSKKTKETLEKKASELKNASKSSTTAKRSSKSKQGKTKPGIASQAKTKPKKLSQLSIPAEAATPESSRRGLRQDKSGDITWDDKDWESTGWSKPRRMTKEERQQFTTSFMSDGRPKVSIIGRPKKPADEKMNVKTLRLSILEERRFLIQAKKEGFPSWQAWIKKLAEERSSSDNRDA